MIGIVSYGAYVPRYRIRRQTISSAMGWLNSEALPGEKAVSAHDEDSLTMAVSAAMDCLPRFDRKKVDGLFFATTTAPYRERESAALIATALDFRSDIRTADIAHSLKGGTGALVSSCDFVRSGDAKRALVCASDCRQGKPGSSQELVVGDGAAAFLLGNEGVIAGLEGSHQVSYDFPDHWRTAYDALDRTAESRWIRDEGYGKFIAEAVSGLLRKSHLKPKDFSKIAFPCLYLKDHAAIGRALGFTPNQIQEPLFASIGDAGAASPLMMLANMLEDAKPGDRLLVASYGNGSEALSFCVTEEIDKQRDRRGVKKFLSRKKELANYEQFLAFRGILPVEMGMRAEVGPTPVPAAWRDRKTILALSGSKCKRCGTPQYPPQKVCVNPDCGAIGQMEDYVFSDKKSTLSSYTEDYLAFSLAPPQIYGIVDYEGGGRYVFDVTDCDPGSLKVGARMEMTFRKKYFDEKRGIYGYFWKAMPTTE